MSLETRVSDALEAWCGEPPADFTIALEDLWILNRDEPYDPDGIEQLIEKLEDEFSNPPSFQVTATPDDFRAGGKIRTVQQLNSEAAAFPEGESEIPFAPRATARPKMRRVEPPAMTVNAEPAAPQPRALQPRRTAAGKRARAKPRGGTQG